MGKNFLSFETLPVLSYLFIYLFMSMFKIKWGNSIFMRVLKQPSIFERE